MKTMKVTMVRLYCTEGEGNLKKMLSRLHDDFGVRGATVFRGVAGFGASGELHSSSLLDISFDLPQIIEFFDEQDKVSEILAELASSFMPGHVVSWSAEVNI
jgi:PII-like signaling protein